MEKRVDGLELKVVEVRRAEGPITKVPNQHYAGHQYHVPTIDVLEDGSEEEGYDGFRLLRDAKAFDASLPHVPRHPTTKRWMTVNKGRPDERLSTSTCVTYGVIEFLDALGAT